MIDEKCWTIRSVNCVNAALKTLQLGPWYGIWKMPNRATTPMVSSHSPELDGSSELLNCDIALCQEEMIGMLRWATELGRVDMLHEASVMSQ